MHRRRTEAPCVYYKSPSSSSSTAALGPLTHLRSETPVNFFFSRSRSSPPPKPARPNPDLTQSAILAMPIKSLSLHGCKGVFKK